MPSTQTLCQAIFLGYGLWVRNFLKVKNCQDLWAVIKVFFSECDWSLSVFEASVTRVTIYWNDQFWGTWSKPILAIAQKSSHKKESFLVSSFVVFVHCCKPIVRKKGPFLVVLSRLPEAVNSRGGPRISSPFDDKPWFDYIKRSVNVTSTLSRPQFKSFFAHCWVSLMMNYGLWFWRLHNYHFGHEWLDHYYKGGHLH